MDNIFVDEEAREVERADEEAYKCAYDIWDIPLVVSQCRRVEGSSFGEDGRVGFLDGEHT